MVQNSAIRSSLSESGSSGEIINIISQWEEDNEKKEELL
jgi:hypothetical protein